jgi:molybdopterin-containing oxidoreductase family membrane subunit
MKERTQKIVKVLWLVIFLIGVVAMIFKFATGERLVGYGSYVPWGLWVALYFHFVGIAGGVFVTGVGGYIMNFPGFRENIRNIMVISAASLVAGMLSIWLDLGQAFRFQNVFLSPNFGSMMTFNAWSYMFFLATMAVVFYLSLKKEKATDFNDKSGWLVPFMYFGLLLAIAFPSQSGSFFGVVDAKPFWNSGLLPVMFLTSAITSGTAVLLFYFTLIFKNRFIVYVSYQYLIKVLIGGILIYLASEFAEYSISYWSPNSHTFEAAKMVIEGPFWWVFWLVHLGGVVVSLYLLLVTRTMPAYGVASFIIAVTFVSARLNVLIPGQSIAQLKGLQEAFWQERLSFVYIATPLEYFVAFFIASFAIGLAYFGIKFISKFEISKIES